MIQRPESEFGVFSGDFTGPGQALAAGAKQAVASLHQSFKGTLIPLEVLSVNHTTLSPAALCKYLRALNPGARRLPRARIDARGRCAPSAQPAAPANSPRCTRRRYQLRGGLQGEGGGTQRPAERPAVPQAVEHGGHQGAGRVGRRAAGRHGRRAAQPGALLCPAALQMPAEGRGLKDSQRVLRALSGGAGARLHGGHRHGCDAPGPAAQPVDEPGGDERPRRQRR